MEPKPEAEGYPKLLRRLRGVFIDGFVVPLAAMGTLLALTYAGVENTWIKVAGPVLVVFLLDPVAVSATGGSIGHHLTGLRVRKDRVDERIGVLAATVRFAVKALFGLPAFFVAFVTQRRQGLHDLAAQSLIVHKSAASLPSYEVMPARTSADEHAAYASVWRRLGVIALYGVLFYLAISYVLAVVISGPCTNKPELCTPTQLIGALVGMATLLCGLVAIAALGWRGRLYGCRKPGSSGA